MYNHDERQMILRDEFFLPFGGKLNPQNRWCKLSALIPWADIEEKYAKNFKNRKKGQAAKSVRMALGAVIIQNRKRLSDRETVEEITENPYMQYFIGLHTFTEKPPFNASLMVYFRKRLGKDIITEVNELIASPKQSSNDSDNDDTPSSN